jgi:hypothetical protein
MFIAEKPESHRYDTEKGRNSSIDYFVMMGYSCQTDNRMSASVSVFCHFLFLSAHLLLLARTHLQQMDLSFSPRKIYQVTGNTFQCFSSAVTNFEELNQQDFVQSASFCQHKHFNFALFFDYGSP